MSKTNSINQTILKQIKSGDLKMKPKWYFALGSLLLLTSLVVIFTGVTFLFNIIFFMTRRLGGINWWRLDMIFSHIPLWIPILALGGVILGLYLLKKYDFSYKKNFSYIIIIVLSSIIIASWSIDHFGFNQVFSNHQPMHRFYQHLNIDGLNSTNSSPSNLQPRGRRGRRMMLQ